MTAREIFDATLVELNKVNAPSMLLEDFNYFINKAINQYINKRYNIYDVNQQTTDDLRVLKSTVKLTPYRSRYNNNNNNTNDIYNATYEVMLPNDYLHVLNCICVFKVITRYKCYNPGTTFTIGATRLTADSWSKIITDFYQRPSYKRPYYYINNINTSETEPYDLYNKSTGLGTDQITETPDNFNNTKVYVTENNNDILIGTVKDLGLKIEGLAEFNLTNAAKQSLNETNLTGKDRILSGVGWHITERKKLFSNTYLTLVIRNNNVYLIGTESEYIIKADEKNFLDVYNGGDDSFTSSFPKEVVLGNNLSYDIQDKYACSRHSNQSKVICEIRCGRDRSVFELSQVYIDYIKSPQYVRLTQEQIDSDLDYSQVMEYPDYICQEIINELVTIIMENSGDARLQNHLAVSQSIASPTQQQASQPQQNS